MGDGFDQRLIFAPARAGNGAGGFIESFANFLAPRGNIDLNKYAAQFFGVVLWCIDDDRRFSVQNAVAAAGVSSGYAGDLNGDDGRA